MAKKLVFVDDVSQLFSQGTSAPTADALSAQRSITLTGDVVGTVTTDMSGNVTIPTTVQVSATWKANTMYAKNAIVGVSTQPMMYLIAQNAGKSGTTEPVITTTPDKTYVDNEITWLSKSRAYVDQAKLADKATILAAARTIGVGGVAIGTPASFDGSKDVSIDITSITRAAAADAADKISATRMITLTGDVTGSTTSDLSGDITINTKSFAGSIWRAAVAYTVGSIVSVANNPGMYLTCAGAGTSGAVEPKITNTPTKNIVDGSVTWDSYSRQYVEKSHVADILSTARNISLTGVAIAAATPFDGSKDISLNVTSVSQATNATYATQLAPGRTFSITGKGIAEAVSFDGTGDVSLDLQDVNAATADRWFTPRTLNLSGDLVGSTVIDGSGDMTMYAYSNVSYLWEPSVNVTCGDVAVPSEGYGTIWQPGMINLVGDVVDVPTITTVYFRCTTAGISGSTTPVWNQEVGETTPDGTAIWTAVAGEVYSRWNYRMQCVDIVKTPWEATHDYERDTVCFVDNQPSMYLVCKVSGRSGNTAPVVDTTEGKQYIDGGVTWVAQQRAIGLTGTTEPDWASAVNQNLIDGQITWHVFSISMSPHAVYADRAGIADALTTARNISIIGTDASGSSQFKGDADMDISLVVHHASNATSLADQRSFSIIGTDVTAPAIAFNGTGDVALAATVLQAPKLTTARNISVSGDAITDAPVPFDGSADIALPINVKRSDTADVLTTARNIGLTGAVTGNADFKGDQDVSIATTIGANTITWAHLKTS